MISETLYERIISFVNSAEWQLTKSQVEELYDISEEVQALCDGEE